MGVVVGAWYHLFIKHGRAMMVLPLNGGCWAAGMSKRWKPAGLLKRSTNTNRAGDRNNRNQWAQEINGD